MGTPHLIPHDVCLACRGCCRFSESDSPWTPSLLDEEVTRLIFAGVPPSCISGRKKVRAVPDPAPGSTGYVCALLSPSDNRCRMYEQRPFECRLYPFLLARAGAGIALVYDPHCPYVQRHQHDHAFKAYARKLRAYLRTPRARAVIARNGRILQDYPGVAVYGLL